MLNVINQQPEKTGADSASGLKWNLMSIDILKGQLSVFLHLPGGRVSNF